MTTDRKFDEQMSEAVHDAYRLFSLSDSQRRQHRERLDTVARRRGSVRLRSHLAEVVVVAAIALIAVSGFLYWNSLEPGSNDDDAALADATATDVKCFSEIAVPVPPEVLQNAATQVAAGGYVDCTTSPETASTPTYPDCLPLEHPRDAVLNPSVPAEVTQPISGVSIDGDRIFCPPEPTPTFTPAPTPLPTAPGAEQYGFINGRCAVTRYADGPPPNPGQVGFAGDWFGGDVNALWVGLGREMEGVWSTDNPILWWSPEPLQITVEGRRLDGEAPPLEERVAPEDEALPDDGDAPGPSRWHQIGSLSFPEPGCWEVIARAGVVGELRFVIEVVPYDESWPAVRARQHIEAVAAERDGTIPFPIPETCAAGEWSGPDNRLLGQYPDAVTAGADWRYSYFLDGDGLSLNTRLGLLFQGTNTVFWLSTAGPLPADATFVARAQDGAAADQESSLAGHPSTYTVQTSDGQSVTVQGAEINFPSDGCWDLRVESKGISFSQTVYVYPPAADRAEAARDHERLYTIDLDGRLRGIDLETGARFFSIWVRSYADVALSPDGLTLYAANHDDQGATLAAYDAITGAQRWHTTREYGNVGYLGDGGPPTIVVSADGGTLYVFESDFQDGQPHRMIATYDAASGQFMARAPFPEDNVFLNSCAASLWPSLVDDRLLAVCKGGTNFITLDMFSGESSGSTGIPVSGVTVETVGAVDAARAYLVTDQGNVASYDRESMEMVESVELITDVQPAWSGAALSPDGSRLYVALSSTETGAYFREVRIFDTTSWEEIDRFELPFDGFGRSMAVDSVGNLYGIELLNRETSYPSNTQVWKRDAVTGEVTVILVADAEVHQLLLAP